VVKDFQLKSRQLVLISFFPEKIVFLGLKKKNSKFSKIGTNPENFIGLTGFDHSDRECGSWCQNFGVELYQNLH
jgi:hypothetical protein